MQLHSVVDQITNSSTEIYIFEGLNTPELVHKFFNDILKIAGSDQKSEDLFDVKQKYEEDLDEDIDEYGRDFTNEMNLDPITNQDEFIKWLIDNKDNEYMSGDPRTNLKTVIYNKATGEKFISIKDLISKKFADIGAQHNG
jgi:hypothetical protein